MNIPNLITLFRLFLIPLFILVFFSGLQNSMLFSVLIFLVAGGSDVLDGYIARRFKLITDWGTVLDPLADKLMLITVLSCLTIGEYIPVWILFIIVLKEFVMVCIASILYLKGVIIPSNIIGKFSTAFFYLSIFIFVFNEQIGLYLIYLSVLLAVIAFINYCLVYSKHHKGTLKS